jgi:DNA (cytosine-5)-methyltransferase 1
MTHGSLFSGIGGFDLAAQWMGWENKFHCEWNEFGQKVLHHYWPDAELFTDITKSDFKKYHGAIDIISGGFPCQPYSMAGKRLGKEDDRHLWPEMLRVIREVRPRWVVGENVLGLVNWNGGLVFHEVQADLETEGYEVQPYVLPAAAVNAPHRRDRVWFVAYSNLRGRCRQKGVREYDLQRSQREKSDNNIIASSERLEQRGFAEFASDTDNTGTDNILRTKRNREKENNGRDEQSFSKHREDGSNGDAADTDLHGRNERNGEHEEQSGERGFDAQRDIEPNDGDGSFEYTNSIRQEYALEDGELERRRFGKSDKRNAWDTFPSVSPICGGNDGLPNKLDGITFSKWRNESIKAYGNAVVPQVVYQIFKAIQEYENKYL